MNKVTKLFKDISNEELKESFEEIIQMNETGFLCDGVTRRIQREYKEIVNIREYVFDHVIRSIVDEVALRTYGNL